MSKIDPMEKVDPMEMSGWNDRHFAAGLKMAEMLTNGVNHCYDSPFVSGFVEGLSRSHRTLQQGATRTMMCWLRRLSETKEGWYDARNEGSVIFARSIKKQLDESYLPSI